MCVCVWNAATTVMRGNADIHMCLHTHTNTHTHRHTHRHTVTHIYTYIYTYTVYTSSFSPHPASLPSTSSVRNQSFRGFVLADFTPNCRRRRGRTKKRSRRRRRRRRRKGAGGGGIYAVRNSYMAYALFSCVTFYRNSR